MKKTLKVLLIIFLILAIVAGITVLWQWKNIKSIILGISEDSEHITQLRTENQEKLVEDITTFMDSPIRDMTEEEKKQIIEGEIAANDVYQKMFEEKIETDAPAKEPVTGNETGNKSDEVPKETKDQIISRHMVELYRLQNEFNARAEATISQGANYYESIKTHDHDATARANTISRFTPIVRGVESECDAKVENVIKNLEKELKAIGADTAVIATIRATYQNEKRLKLSYYANKYLK